MQLDLTLLLFIVHTLGAGCAIIAIWYARTPQSGTAWAIFLITFPYGAIPLYIFFGAHRFHGYSELRRSHVLQTRKLFENHLENAYTKYPVDINIQKQFHDLVALSKLPLVSNCSVELLIDGDKTFSSIFDAIDKAKKYVLIEFFIIKNDQIGTEFSSTLKKAAARGITIYVAYDKIGSHALPEHYINDLRQSGIDIREFASTRLTNRFQVNFRNHRKIVVVDGEIGFTGGLNIGDEYLGRSKKFWPVARYFYSNPRAGSHLFTINFF